MPDQEERRDHHPVERDREVLGGPSRYRGAALQRSGSASSSSARSSTRSVSAQAVVDHRRDRGLAARERRDRDPLAPQRLASWPLVPRCVAASSSSAPGRQAASISLIRASVASAGTEVRDRGQLLEAARRQPEALDRRRRAVAGEQREVGAGRHDQRVVRARLRGRLRRAGRRCWSARRCRSGRARRAPG